MANKKVQLAQLEALTDRVAELEVELDQKDERIDELEAQLTEYKRFAGSEFADVRGRITDVEEQAQALESSTDTTTSEDANEMPTQTSETPLERICGLPE